MTYHTHGYGSGYFGGGESFVFSLAAPAASPTVYRWTRKNSFFCMVRPEGLGFGGGGHFAVFVDADLDKGITGRSDTFDNPPLIPPSLPEADGTTASDVVDFRVLRAEVWAFEMPSFAASAPQPIPRIPSYASAFSSSSSSAAPLPRPALLVPSSSTGPPTFMGPPPPTGLPAVHAAPARQTGQPAHSAGAALGNAGSTESRNAAASVVASVAATEGAEEPAESEVSPLVRASSS
jgi:hypothetical protein